MSENKELEKTKRQKCKFCHPFVNRELLISENKENQSYVIYKCFKHKKENGESTIINDEICNNCKDYKCKYIEYPLTINGIDFDNERFKDIYKNENCGKYVGVRICEENNEETYLGIFLGDLPFINIATHNEKTNKLKISPICNPTIFIPKLNRIVFGMECFWYELENMEDLKTITNEDIENVWYVQALKSFKTK